MENEILIKQSFDVYQRFSGIIDILQEAGAIKDGDIIVDVGGYPGMLADALDVTAPAVRTVTVDHPHARRPGYARGSAENLPLKDKSADVVIASDVLEHIPTRLRSDVISEMIRISRRWIVFGAPFDHPVVTEADERLNELYRKVDGMPNKWLLEHIENGLPKLEAVTNKLKDAGASVSVIPNGSVVSWFIMASAQALFDCLPLVSGFKPMLSEMFNRVWASLDEELPPYRHIIIGDMKSEYQKENIENIKSTPVQDEKALEKMAAIHDLALKIIEELNTRLADTENLTPHLAARTVRQLEEIIEFQEKEVRRLTEGLQSRDKVIEAYQSNPLFKLLSRLGLK